MDTQAEQVPSGEQPPSPPQGGGICGDVVRALSPADRAAVRWRRLAAAALRISVWRPWAAARAGASASGLAAPPVAARVNLLMDTTEGRIAMADAIVAHAEHPGRAKRKAEELSSPPAASAEEQPPSHPRLGRAPLSYAAASSARAGAASASVHGSG